MSQPSQPSSQIDSIIWLRAFRHRILTLLLGSLAVLSTLGMVFSLWRISIGKGDPVTIFPYTLAYLAVLALFFLRRISDEMSTLAFLSLLYFFAIYAFYSGWLASSGRTFLLAFILLTAILIGPRAGLLAALFSILSYACLGLAFSEGWLQLRPLASPVTAPPIIIEGVGFVMAVGMIVIGLWFMNEGIVAANQATVDSLETRTQLAERAHQLDEANRLLAERSANLESANLALQTQTYLASARAQVSDLLRSVDDPAQMPNAIIQHLCRSLDSQAGAFYVMEEGILALRGGYAYMPSPGSPDRFASGEGLIGQAGRDRQMRIIHNIPPGGMLISSGLGDTKPACLLILPLIYNERLSGVIALATLNEFTLEQQVFLEDIAESIAMDLLARRSQSSQA